MRWFATDEKYPWYLKRPENQEERENNDAAVKLWGKICEDFQVQKYTIWGTSFGRLVRSVFEGKMMPERLWKDRDDVRLDHLRILKDKDGKILFAFAPYDGTEADIAVRELKEAGLALVRYNPGPYAYEIPHNATYIVCTKDMVPEGVKVD